MRLGSPGRWSLSGLASSSLSRTALAPEATSPPKRSCGQVPMGIPCLKPPHRMRGTRVCTENLIRIDCVTESPNDWVPEEQAPPPQSALPSSRRGGRSRSTHLVGLAGYPGGQVINSGEESPQDRGRVRLMISDDQIDGRRLAFQGTADDRPVYRKLDSAILMVKSTQYGL
jgi:hypothetical protein